MKKTVLFPIITVVLAALVLMGASFGLQNIAASNAQAEHLAIMQTILPGSQNFTVEPYDGEDPIIHSVHKGENGFVIETVTSGYAGDITMLIGVSTEGKVTGLVVRELSETLGLGANALGDHVFLSQFLNTSGNVAVGTGTDAFSGATGSSTADADTYVDAISGATVTSKAIARSVNAAVAYVTGADIDSGATSWGG